MKKKLIAVGIITLFLLMSFSTSAVITEKEELEQTDSDDSKKIVHIIGKSHSYKFGGIMHIGRLWWCPNPEFSISFSFAPEELYLFRINGRKQNYDEDSRVIYISMTQFFGLAPTLANFVYFPPDIISVYGICSEVNVREFE